MVRQVASPASDPKDVKGDAQATKEMGIRREIEVNIKYGKKGTDMSISQSDAPQREKGQAGRKEHDWLTCMGKFANYVASLNERLKKSAKSSADQTTGDHDVESRNTRQSVTSNEHVVVALLDDGVDFYDEDFSGRSLDGYSFDHQDGSMGQKFTSADGHGTTMAKMIYKVCPMASIYSIRLKTHPGSDGGPRTIDDDSVASVSQKRSPPPCCILSPLHGCPDITSFL
jgi:hypothetical protein